jgi:hypothetical protein
MMSHAIELFARVSLHAGHILSIDELSSVYLVPSSESNQVSQEGRDDRLPALVPGFAHHFAAN